MVLEGLRTEERPTAVGYFVLDTVRSLLQSGITAMDDIRLSVALVTPTELEDLKKCVHVFIPPKDVEDLGPLYKLILDVSRGVEEADEQP